MIPVYQTIFAPPLGNCYAACVASLMELTLEEVPNFAEWYVTDPDNAWRRSQLWCAERGWLFVHWYRESCGVGLDIALPTATPLIVTVKSPRGDWNHCVVADMTLERVLHDPVREGVPVDLATAVEFDLILPATQREQRRMSRLRSAARVGGEA